MLKVLIDAGPLVAYYNKGDKWHTTTKTFFENFRGKLFTSEPVATEVMWLLAQDWRVQNEFLDDVHKELYQTVPLELGDFKYIAELNDKYKDRPADFTDLSIVVIGERLDVLNVVSLDSDFDIYRTHSNKPFQQLFPKWDLTE